MTRSNQRSHPAIRKAMNSKKRIRFDQIEIIELPVTLGDNPSVKDGPPVSCSWDAQLRATVNLDLFEQCRPKRRGRRNLVLGRRAREDLLSKHGVSEGAMYEASLEANRVKTDRMVSMQCLARGEPVVVSRQSSYMIPTACSLLEEIAAF